MRDSPAKRQKILSAAASLFVDVGYEGTTFAKLAQKSGMAVGSIVHFFGDKADLAAAIHGCASERLIRDAEAALTGHGTDVEKAVRALQSACLRWAIECPDHARLIALLEVNSPEDAEVHISRIEVRLGWLLAGWAKQLRLKHVARLSQNHLYAIILAPAMYAATRVTGSKSVDDKSTAQWLSVLTAASMGALG
jgi:AcrR family transcriptional regulator